MGLPRKSVNFRLDPKLVMAARKKAEKENTTLTALIVRGLSIVLGKDKNVDYQSQIDELKDLFRSQFKNFDDRLSQIEQSQRKR